MRFSDNTQASLGEMLGIVIPGTDTASGSDRKMTMSQLASYFSGARLREASLLDIFGTSDVQAAIGYAVSQPEAVRLGDYVDLPAFSFTDDILNTTVNVTTTGANSRIRIAGNPNPLKGTGDTENTAPVLFEFANCPFVRRINATDTNTNDYGGTELFAVLTGNFASALQQVVGSSNVIENSRILLPKGNASSDWEWKSAKTFLLSETQVFGQKNVGSTEYQIGNSFPLPLYTFAPEQRIKRYNGTRQSWWLCSAYRILSNSSYFALVGYSGSGATWDRASHSSGVSPAFGIKNQ